VGIGEACRWRCEAGYGRGYQWFWRRGEGRGIERELDRAAAGIDGEDELGFFVCAFTHDGGLTI